MIFWIVWLIFGLFFIIMFSVVVIPKIMLKTYAATLPIRLKVVERRSGEYGETIVYYPTASARRYVKRYSIGCDECGVFFCGEWEENSAFVEYELTVYGSDGNIIEILRIKEKFNKDASMHITRLPKATDYATLRIVCVDDNPIPAERCGFNFKYALWLFVLCLCFAVTTDLLLWLGITFAMRCLDRFTMQLVLPLEIWTMVLGYAALAITAGTCIFSLGGFFLRRKGGIDE